MSARVLIIVTAPPENAEAILDAIVEAGGGTIGSYTHCAFIVNGFGQFQPTEDATPYSGEVEMLNTAPEVRIETFAPRISARAIVQAIRAAHPYDEPVIHIVPLLEESDL